MLRIAVVGDRFITPELVSQLIVEQVEPVTGPCAVRSLQLAWPDDTPIHNDELQEYTGDPAEIAAFVGDAHVVVTQVAPVSRRLIEQAPYLQIIAAARGGPVSVNVAAATEQGIPVAYAPGSNAQAVAEFTIGLILAESKHIARAHHALVEGVWRVDAYHYDRSPRELRGQTVGIIGFGHVGQLLVPYLTAFGLRVLVYDPYVSAERCHALGAQPVQLATLLAESDYVTLHARVTAETRGMMGAAEFAQMKPGAIFVNSARGPLVDYDALYAALKSGHLGGAALDNFAVEPPPPDWPLLKLDNVTLTPHIAGSSRQTAHRKVEMVLQDVANFYAGRPLIHCFNPEAFGKSRPRRGFAMTPGSGDAPLLVGIDVGTTSVKAVLFDVQGNALLEQSQEYPTYYPHPNWAEQQPEAWWQAACTTLQGLFAGGRFAAARVAAVGISCQAPSMVAVDQKGRALAPAMIWMDRRSEAQCTWLREQVGQETITRINGGRIDPYYMAPKLLWFKENCPELYRETYQVLQANGYLIHKLCGVFCMDDSHGPISLCFDSASGNWSQTLVDAMKLDRAKLPAVMPCSNIVGEVGASAAEATGLAAGTPVVAGMTDGTAASLEAGLVHVGDAVEMTGQSTVLLVCSDRPYLGDDLIPLGHAVPGRHLVVGALVASGGALRWFRDQFGEVERAEAARRGIDPFDVLTEAAATSPAGANRLIFLPYLFGERSPIWDSDARGVFMGLTLASRKQDLIRAIMEGAAYGLRHNVETAARAGFAVATLACVGGGARSTLWNQIKADVLGRPVRLPRAAIGAPLGDAMVAAVGVGLYPSIEAAVAQMVVPGAEYQPRAEVSARYDALYRIYIGLYPALKESFLALARVP